MSKKYLLILLVVLLALASCNKKTETPGGKRGAADDLQPVMIEELKPRTLDEYVLVSGKLEGIVNITMNSETSGRILELYKKLGDNVSKGERLGRVENEVYRIRLQQAEAALLSAQAGFENAQRNANYAEASKRSNLISDAELSSVISALKGAQAGLDGAKASVEASRMAYESSYLSAPEAGTISFLNVSTGQLINPGQPVATIIDASTLILKTGVGETQIGKIRKGQRVQISYPGSEEPIMASVRAYGISPMQGSATYPIEIELKNNGKLLPGMVVSARILSNSYQNMLYTTLTNIITEFGRTYIYVVEDENIVKRKEVALGMVIGENVVLRAGVEIGEKIVTSGAENLEDGIKVQIRK